MPIIEGIGDEVVLVVGTFMAVVCMTLAWFSTQVRERPRPEVVVLDRNRIVRAFQRIRTATTNTLTNTPVGYIIRGSSSSTSSENGTPGETSEAANSNAESSNEAVSVLYAEVRANESDSQGNTTRAEIRVSPTLQPAPSQPSTSPTQPQPSTSLTQPQPSESPTQAQPSTSPTQPQPTTTSQQTSSQPTTSTSTQPPPSATSTSNTASEITHDVESDTVSSTTANESELRQRKVDSHSESTPSEAQESPPVTQESPSEIPESERLDGHIRVRLKYLDERQRLVQTRPDSTIEQFKRLVFSSETSSDTSIRLIFNGQELRGERTLQSYNIGDHCVIHCLLSRSPAPEQSNTVEAVIPFDMGTLAFPLFGLVLTLIWYCRVTYRSYFNPMSTFSLIGITFLYIVALMASFRNNHRQHEHAH